MDDGDMGNVAKLFPYRDSNGRLLFRGKVGCKKADGVTEGVSKFFPVRVDGRLLLRGKRPDGKILYGYTYRDASGRLMGRTLADFGSYKPDSYYLSGGFELTFEATSYCHGPPYDDDFWCRQAVGAYSVTVSASLVETEWPGTRIPLTHANWTKSAVVNSCSGILGHLPCGSEAQTTWAEFFSIENIENLFFGAAELRLTVTPVGSNNKLAVDLGNLHLPRGRFVTAPWHGRGEVIVAKSYKGLVSIPLVDATYPVPCHNVGTYITVSGTAAITVRIT